MDIISDDKLVKFWENTNKNGPLPDQSKSYYHGLSNCWQWGLAPDGNGYGGAIAHKGEKRIKAHRLSWMIHNGPIEGNLYVCHQCDNRLCVNPDHMFLGTTLDNITDRHAKGRSKGPIGEKNGHYTKPESTLRGDKHPSRLKPWTRPRGSAHGISKLTESQVIQMRKEYKDGGETYASLSRRYGVSNRMIKLIINRIYWKHV